MKPLPPSLSALRLQKKALGCFCTASLPGHPNPPDGAKKWAAEGERPNFTQDNQRSLVYCSSIASHEKEWVFRAFFSKEKDRFLHIEFSRRGNGFLLSISAREQPNAFSPISHVPSFNFPAHLAYAPTYVKHGGTIV